MLSRTTLAMLLLLPSAISAQDLDTAVFALVRISGTRYGTPVRGSGFVVGLDRDQATIVTASHVIEGVQQIEVTFAVDPTRSLQAGIVLGLDAGNPNGLAAFLVRGTFPAGVTTLSFDLKNRPHLGAPLFLLGFPELELFPRTTQRVLSGRRGTLLSIDQKVGEGFSGGPVLQGGKVMGVITDTDEQTTYAVSALVVREALDGWRVKLGGQISAPTTSPATPPKPEAPVVDKCVPGEEHTENDFDFVRICPGSFAMGSDDNDPQADIDEKPAHQVTLGEFWIAKTEITNEQYRRFRADHHGETNLPATGVSWDEAKAACEHFGGRLPTEAEWEYAVRADSRAAWSFGANEKNLAEYAWYDKNSGHTPHEGGTKKANAWGLQDMHGNVWEWVADWYGPYPSAVLTNPKGPATGSVRTVRGAPSSTRPGSCAPRTGTGSCPRTGTSSSASAVPAAPAASLDVCPLTHLVAFFSDPRSGSQKFVELLTKLSDC